MAEFAGYSTDTFRFLAGLVENNERAWFEAHRADYERFVVEPSLSLIDTLDPIVRAISPRYRGVARKLGGSLMRIYRDTRFGHDKTPYKTNIGIQLRHEGAADVHAPGFYIHLDLASAFVGTGCWHPEPSDLKAIRLAVAAHPETYREALAQAAAVGMTPAGESLKNVPRGFDPEHPLAEELKRKDFLVSTDLSADLYLGPELVTTLAQRFQASAAYMRFLCSALGVPF
jgi:uncharacterized protein (TIGR02453 family)